MFPNGTLSRSNALLVVAPDVSVLSRVQPVDLYDIIYNFTLQFPSIMKGLKQIVALAGLVIFVLSVKSLLQSNSHERGSQALAWGGLIFSSFLMSIQRWMNILSNTVYDTDLGPVYLVGSDFQQTNDINMIFDALIVYANAFGWFSLISGTLRFYEAPKFNNPGQRRKAAVLMLFGVFLANPEITIDVIGNTFGYENAFEGIKGSLIDR